MANWQFATDAQSWTGFSFDGGNGSPAFGCLSQAGAGGGGGVSASLTGQSINVTAGDPCSMRVKVIAQSGDLGPIGVTLYLNTGQAITWEFDVSMFPQDSGWQTLSGAAPTTETITDVSVSFDGAPIFDAYVDTIYVAESTGINFTLKDSAGGIPGAVKAA